MSSPSVTLYLSGLNYSVAPKQELRRSLYSLFSTYGKVLDVVHSREQRVRGSAWVVFRDLASSTAAMRALDGESFYGKGLRISYAKGTSYATVEHTEGPEAVYAIKLGLREADPNSSSSTSKGGKLTVSGAQKKLIDERRKEKRGREEEDGEEEEEEEEEDEEEAGPERKKTRQEDDDDVMEESDDEPEPAPGPANAAEGSEPSPILYIEGLPAEVTTDILETLFKQYPGFSSTQLLPLPTGAPKNTGTAFVRYGSADQAAGPKAALDGFLIDKGVAIKVHYARRA
ncbi:hypothetical protein JCM8097_004520 [Rhodosporidiobolus ruineniae]